MKIYMPEIDQSKMGGGWSFAEIFFKYNEIHAFENADTFFIPGATQVDREKVHQAKERGMKIVLRIDNHLLPSRNRNSGMQKLKEYAELADLVVYQSEWAKKYIGGIIGKDGVVILNAVDLDVFKPEPSMRNDDGVLYARSSRINEKGWDMVRYWFTRAYMENPKLFLTIIGKFSGENMEHNFDFFNGENFRFYGQIRHNDFAVMLRQNKYFLYSYFMDACSNTLIEALCSGCEVIDIYGMLRTGGAPEIMLAWADKGRDYFGYDRMINEYRKVMESL
jgi:glycosyltransferase involved in cell wall biosynthesis